MSLADVAENGCNANLLRGPAGLWTAIDKAGFAKRVIQGGADPAENENDKRG